MGTGEIIKATRAPATTLTNRLKRLDQRGLVERDAGRRMEGDCVAVRSEEVDLLATGPPSLFEPWVRCVNH
jgi:hypothetical protein